MHFKALHATPLAAMQTPSPLALSVVLALVLLLPILMMCIVLLVLPQVSLYAGCCKYELLLCTTQLYIDMVFSLLSGVNVPGMVREAFKDPTTAVQTCRRRLCIYVFL